MPVHSRIVYARRLFTGEENKEYNKFFVEVWQHPSRSGRASQHALTRKAFLAGGGTTRLWPTDETSVEKAISRESLRN